MTGKNLRANLLIGSMALVSLGFSLVVAPSDSSHFSHLVGTVMILAGAITAGYREKVKEDQAVKSQSIKEYHR